MSIPLTKKQRYDTLRGKLKLERSSWEPWWRDLADYIQPDKAMFLVSDRNRGDRRNIKIIDTTATYSSRTLGSGMHSGMTNPARPWHRLTTEDPELAEYGPVKQWLQTVRQRMSAIFLRSNLYQVLPSIYEDTGVFGTGVMAVMDDDEDIIRCFDYPIGSYYLATDGKRRVRVFVHEYALTVRQLVENFGRKTPNGSPDWSVFSPRVKSLYDRGSYEEWIEVVQVIEPNEQYSPGRLHAKFKPFSSCHYEVGAPPDRVLAESGYDEFPILAARWHVRGNDVYGRNAPGMIALGDVKQLQTMEKRGAQALEKMINPPILADPSMTNTALSMLPGNVSYGRTANGNPAAVPLHQTDVRLDFLETKADRIRQSIRRAFHEDLFLMLSTMPDRSDITATEIMERKEEKILALGPVLERYNQDVFNPLIDRTFAIMDRRGLLPEAPDELQGQPLKIEYESVMAQAQKASALSGVERLTGYVLNIVERTGNPSALDKFDVDQAIDEYGEAASVPPRLIRPDEDVQQIREGRAQQEQAAQQAATLKDAAAGAKTLSETDTTSPNALTDLLGMGEA